MADTLTDDAIETGLADLDGWKRDGDAITRSFDAGDFRSAVAFIVRIGFEAEERNHHPELSNVYKTVDIRLTSHDAGGITQRDLDLAAAIDAVAP